MATREEIVTLISYVLGDRNRQLLLAGGIESLSAETRISALRGLQDLGWIGHSGMADFAESYSITKDGRRILSEKPTVYSLEACSRDHVQALRTIDGGDQTGRKDGLKKLVIIDCDRGNWDSALIHCYQLRRSAESPKDAGAKAFALFHQSKVEMVQNRWDDALESLLNANESFVEAGDTKGVAMTNRAIGVIYANKGDHASAIRCFESSMSMARMIGDEDLEAKAEGNLANIYNLEGRLDEAEKAHKKCLEYFLASGDQASAARTANNLGVLAMIRDNYRDAVRYFDQAVESCRKIKNREVLGIALVNGGYCQIICNELSKSLSYTDEAVAIFKEEEDKHRLALAYRNYGSIEMRNSKLDSAIDWFEKSIRVAKASGVEDTIAACYYEYGMSLIQTVTDLRFGRKLLKKSAAMYRSMGNSEKAKTIEGRIATA